MPKFKTVNILGLQVANVSTSDVLSVITTALRSKSRILITYANFNTIYLCADSSLQQTINRFQLIHPDGIATYIASKLLYGNNGLANRLTGSDIYNCIILDSVLTQEKLFFFGDTSYTIEMIHKSMPAHRIAGAISGFNFITDDVISEINAAKPGILLVGLGTPLQENWIMENAGKIDCPVIIAVGEGIKIFAGIKKRGPRWVQSAGLEWIVRLFYQPKYLLKRYTYGFSLFLFRVIKQ